VRYNIRMKMYLASGIEFESALDAQAKKKKPTQAIVKVTGKVTAQPASSINRAISLSNDAF